MGQEDREGPVRIVLDTSVCIELFRKNPTVMSFVQRQGNAKPAISAVTLFELMLRKYNLDMVEIFTQSVDLLDIDGKAAREAASITKELRKSGQSIDSHDVFIAATAIANNCQLATLDSDFSRIKGLRLVKLR